MPNESKTPYGLLLNEISISFLPKIEVLGFELVPLSPEDKKTEMRYREPFGALKRSRPTGLDLVEIVFYEDRTPKFIINFGTAPKEGIFLPWGQELDMDNVHTSALPISYQLSSSKVRKKPFSFGFFQKPNAETAAQVVGQAVDYLEEIEDWFKNKTIGKHVFLKNGPR